MTSTGYLGPVGTFCEAAARALGADDLVPFPDISAVLRAVDGGQVAQGVVPIENRLEGGVTATLLALADDVDLLLTGETELPIELLLAGPVAGHPVDALRRVVSHPVALGACRRFLSASAGAAAQEPTSSTASAAEQVAAAGDPTVAAIANPLAVERYGLHVLARDVADVPRNRTRFVEVGRRIPARTGWDKTSLVVFLPSNAPGSLLRILEVLAERDVDMTRLESRPTDPELGSYRFFVDVAGHLDDERVADAVAALHRTQREVKVLGSYPRFDERPVATPDLAADDATFRDAAAWVRAWRDRVERP